ncbi:unnamed protein product [Thelazia callipaeda]|uniref:Uncharacterized protein n=1 Tax=Thelazia callipaeda TaxID=103827 RepID=A0A0N5D3Z0_THECL|nr:unnamed protein product [Thelazia callipaeda]
MNNQFRLKRSVHSQPPKMHIYEAIRFEAAMLSYLDEISRIKTNLAQQKMPEIIIPKKNNQSVVIVDSQNPSAIMEQTKNPESCNKSSAYSVKASRSPQMRKALFLEMNPRNEFLESVENFRRLSHSASSSSASADKRKKYSSFNQNFSTQNKVPLSSAKWRRHLYQSSLRFSKKKRSRGKNKDDTQEKLENRNTINKEENSIKNVGYPSGVRDKESKSIAETTLSASDKHKKKNRKFVTFASSSQSLTEGKNVVLENSEKIPISRQRRNAISRLTQTRPVAEPYKHSSNNALRIPVMSDLANRNSHFVSPQPMIVQSARQLPKDLKTPSERKRALHSATPKQLERLEEALRQYQVNPSVESEEYDKRGVVCITLIFFNFCLKFNLMHCFNDSKIA